MNSDRLFVIENHLDKQAIKEFYDHIKWVYSIKSGSHYQLRYLISKYIIAFYDNSEESTNINNDLVNYRAKVIKGVLTYLDNNLGETVKVSDLCQELFISQSTLYKIIMKNYKLSPQLFILNHKLIRSLALLKKKENNIQDIARMTGFNTIYHFSKVFKDKYGLSPKQFQKKYFSNTI